MGLWCGMVIQSRWFRVALDLLVLVLLVLMVVVVKVTQTQDLIVQRGFFCEDTSIRLPYKDDTIPYWGVFLAALSINILALTMGNVYEYYWYKRDRDVQAALVCRLPILPWILRLGYQLRWFFKGLFLTIVLTDISKSLLGKLRPNFIDVCDPDFSLINCTDQYGLPVYISDYECHGDATDARLSWPSAHMSLASYAFIFVALYVAGMRAHYQRSGIQLLLVFLALLLMLMTGISRISDNKHHPSDVLGGFIYGAVIAAVIVYYHLQFFSHFKHRCAITGTSPSAQEAEDNEVIPLRGLVYESIDGKS